MPAVPPPPKLKAALATIKEQYLDNDGSSQTTIQQTWEGLYKIELLLRGTILTEDSQLYDKVNSAIGKSLLKDDQIPKPLLAGMNVMAGRIAERCGDLILQTAAAASSSSQGSSPSRPSKEISSVLDRANSIKDERWKILLKAASTSELDLPLWVAQGYYTTAALIQHDTPPMWKKVWDLWNKRLSSSDECPFLAQPSIENMIRIATNKGNTKRVAELQLKLTQCYLNGIKSSKSKLVSKEAMETSTNFGDTVTPKLVLKLNNDDDHGGKSSLSQLAQKSFEKCQLHELSTDDKNSANDDDDDQFMYHIVAVEVLLVVQDAAIYEVARTTYDKNQNRSISSSLEQCLQECREQFLASNYDDDASSSLLFSNLYQTGITLRDILVTKWPQQQLLRNEENDDDSCMTWIRCMKVTKQVIELLMERGNAKVKKDNKDYLSAWRTVLEYILPILSMLRDSICKWNIDSPRKRRIDDINSWLNTTMTEEKSFTTFLSLTLPFGCWMMLGSSSSSPSKMRNDDDDAMMTYIVDLLTALFHQPVSEPKEESALGGGSNTSNKEKINLARSAAVCFICQTNSEITFHISRDAISRKKIHFNYLGMLQCFITWSGWYQRPWINCSNLSDARRLLSVRKASSLGRPLSLLESIFVDMAYGDAESFLSGGVWNDAYNRYSNALENVIAAKNDSEEMDDINFQMLQAHCNNGLARVCLLRNERQKVVEFAQKTIDSLQSLEINDDRSAKRHSLYIWHKSDVFTMSRSHQLSVARHLIADSLIADGRSEEARSFLEAAVHDAPLDADAALALGAFLMRIHFYETSKEGPTPEAVKATQIQLLKAAKLDAKKASPFALLGLWFEEQGDLQRARGCYTKSLQLEPYHPVAGRGILRLESRDSIKKYLDDATHSSSSYNGWAWRATGLNKAFLDGDDNLAVVSFLKALRCRDIANVDNEFHAVFYDKPGETKTRSVQQSDVLAEVATCYRRLGRYTAAIRAFHGAIEIAGDMVPSLVLCSCAQVELELALFDSAVEKFSMVLQRKKEDLHAIAAYGQGIALLSIAQRDLQDGKAGLAYTRVQEAIDSCQKFSNSFGCTQKLLGDLHSFGAALPPDVFVDDNNEHVSVEKQLEFVAKGEDAYNVALENHKSTGETSDIEQSVAAQSADLCDVANSILLQARVLCSKYENANDFRVLDVAEVKGLYDKAAAAFQTSIELNPLYAPAWCGLGCAVVAKDPLLAQHAFCRCLQLEQLFPDAYSNLGFLYTSFSAYTASEGSMNALTQIADTPMMWMNRAMVLERDAASHFENQRPEMAERDIVQAADAYRAALQVMKHPDAQLGLSVTGRMVDSKNEKSMAMEYLTQRKDSTSLMKEFMGSSCRMKVAASVIYGAMSMEQALEMEHVGWSEELVDEGKSLVRSSLCEKELASILDLNSLEACLEGREEGTNTQANQPPFPVEVSLQRQILHTPDRPELWLALSEELSVSMEADCAVSEITSAMSAAERASRMLEESMINSGRGNPTEPVDASMFSEALSLFYILQNLKADRENQQKSQASCFALQRALMMCPNNEMAREARGS